MRRPDGTPVTGAEVDLTHPDLPGSLRTWLAENRVRLDAAPRTDGQGRIELPELPAGPLTWTATGADGERLEGRVDVVAGQLLVVD